MNESESSMYHILLQKFQEGDFSEVISIATSNNVNATNDPLAANVMAAALLSLGSVKESIEIFSDLEPSLGDDDSFLSLYGAALRRSGDLQASKNIFERALLQAPDNPCLKNNYANLLIDMKNYSMAISLLSEVVDAHPEYADAVSNLQRARSLFSMVTNPPSPDVSTVISPEAVNTKSLDLLLDPLLMAFDDEEVRDFGRLKRLDGLEKVVKNVDTRSIGLEKIKMAQKANSEGNPLFALELCSQSYLQLGCESTVFDCASDAYLSLNRFLETEVTILHALAISGPSMKHYINLTSLASMRCDFVLAEHYFKKAVCLDSTNPNLAKLRKFLEDRKSSKSHTRFLFEDSWPTEPLISHPQQ